MGQERNTASVHSQWSDSGKKESSGQLKKGQFSSLNNILDNLRATNL